MQYDAASLAHLECGDFLVSLMCTQKSLFRCSLWVPTGVPVVSDTQVDGFVWVRLVLLCVNAQAL